MRSIHIVLTDLFLPRDFATEACAGLRLPALEKMLARGISTSPGRGKGFEWRAIPTEPRQSDISGVSLENHLCGLFGLPCHPEAPLAPISAAFDGLGKGCWLRADPVHLQLRRDQLLLLPVPDISLAEAVQLCGEVNEHLTGQGLAFFAPHPQRWYVRIDTLPAIETVPLSRVVGRNVNDLLPKGAEALRWHRLFNEIQMLLHSHPVNQARESRGASTVNSVWLWGGGCASNLAVTLHGEYDRVSSDEPLAEMLASAAGIPFAKHSGKWHGDGGERRELLVWTGLRQALQNGNLDAWRVALQDFETGYAQPLWQALLTGKISQLTVEVLSGGNSRGLRLNRADSWAFWRRSRALAGYSLV